MDAALPPGVIDICERLRAAESRASARAATFMAILEDTADLIGMVVRNHKPSTLEEDREALRAQAQAILQALD